MSLVEVSYFLVPAALVVFKLTALGLAVVWSVRSAVELPITSPVNLRVSPIAADSRGIGA